MTRLAIFALAFLTIAPSSPAAPVIERRLPPKGIELSEAQIQEVKAARDHIAERLTEIPKIHPNRIDVEIYHKAISYALEFGEFYKSKDLAAVRELVVAADKRADDIKANRIQTKPLDVWGYRSSIDGSLQPYGIELPKNFDPSKPVALWVWLHGRGDKTTDLYFIRDRLKKPGKLRPPPNTNTLIVHPFGRQCIGWKSAGEIDVLDVINDVSRRLRKIDRDRVALMGFSMGGAGAWHIGAHYTDRFAAVHAGAGFAETARYIKLKPEDFPPSYEQALWGTYDVPNYVRNLFNVPVLAYSGSEDKQIQAARVMEEAFTGEGRKLKHLIGEGMGHKYHPDLTRVISMEIQTELKEGRDPFAPEVHLQTRTLRYNRMHWLAATGLEEHWQDSRIDAKRSGSGVKVTTKNISSLSMTPGKSPLLSINIDGTSLRNKPTKNRVYLQKVDGTWQLGRRPAEDGSRKIPGLQGPIDDAFLSPFLVVLPDKPSANPKIQKWIEFELDHFETRWRATFRGQLRKKRASEVTADDAKRYHLVAFGDPASNPVIAEAVEAWDDLIWDRGALAFAGKKLNAADHLPLMVRPNPRNPKNYLVINSGPTFREAHDRTNSLQNPKLPDWALIDLNQAPDAESAGKVVAADFFDESWKLKK